MKIGYRTLKTVIGVPLAVYISYLAGLQFYTAAGMITLLSIKKTKKESVKSASVRMFAGMMGLAFALACFYLMGYHPLSLGVILLFFIPVLVRFKLQEGLAASMVLILHLYVSESIALKLILNEFILSIVGIGVALILNLYMPNMEKGLIEYQIKIETNFRLILQELVYYLRHGESDWNGKEMLETPELLDKAKNLAFINVENSLLGSKDEFYQYFDIRQKQFEILERIVPLVSKLPQQVEQGEIAAKFLEDLSESIHSGNTAYIFLEKLSDIRTSLKDSPLPKTRMEFETRAVLYQLLSELEHYLDIKQKLKVTQEG